MSRTMLVVDDDPLIRRLIAAIPGDVGGFRLREARDREEALEAAFEDRPEIVLLDYAMPRLDGVGTCRRLRSDPVTAGATIVMLSGLSDGRVRDGPAAAGADHFPAKPFSPLRLLRPVHELGAGRG